MLEFDWDDDHDEQQQKDLDETLRKFRESFRSGTWQNGAPSPEALENIVHYCIESQKYDDALTFSAMWKDAAPYSSDAWHKYGMALSGLLRWDEAIAAYERAAELDPVDTEIMINRGMALEQVGRIDEALTLIPAASSIGRRSPSR